MRKHSLKKKTKKKMSIINFNCNRILLFAKNYVKRTLSRVRRDYISIWWSEIGALEMCWVKCGWWLYIYKLILCTGAVPWPNNVCRACLHGRYVILKLGKTVCARYVTFTTCVVRYWTHFFSSKKNVSRFWWFYEFNFRVSQNKKNIDSLLYNVYIIHILQPVFVYCIF